LGTSLLPVKARMASSLRISVGAIWVKTQTLTLLNQFQSVTVEEVHIDLRFLGCNDLITHYLVLFLVLLDLLLRQLTLLSFDDPLKSLLVINRLLRAHYPK